MLYVFYELLALQASADIEVCIFYDNVFAV